MKDEKLLYQNLPDSQVLRELSSWRDSVTLHITRRELEVLVLIVNGDSTKEIANKLCISDHTVITHRKHLVEKFQARNTAQMVKNACKIYPFD